MKEVYKKGKPFKKHQKPEFDEVASYDSEVISDVDSNMSLSVDSEEEAMRGAEEIKKARKTGKVQDWSGKNTLKLGEFHRNNIGKKGARKPTLKKQIRDIERLIEREGIPEEIKNAKKS